MNSVRRRTRTKNYFNSKALMNLHTAIHEKTQQLKLSRDEYDRILAQLDDTNTLDEEVRLANSILEKLKYRLHHQS